MANEVGNQERVPDNLRSLLAVAVRSVQWSYAIFWSPSNRGQGVLEWGDGYYNGEVKTTRNVRATEIKPDKMGLKRSEQLRELYEFLLQEEIDQQKPGASAALSPEDLTDAEWYYLVCMSFVFNEGEGLPGRAFANDEPIWLSDAHLSGSEVFSRCLLAKSACIQTVICFPHLGGVIELGVTELVSEDPSLIQHIRTSFLDFSKPFCSKKSSPLHGREGDPECIHVNDNHEIVNTMEMEALYSAAADMRFNQDDLKMGSCDDCSKECEHDSMDDSFSNYVQESMASSNFMSPAFLDQEKAIPIFKGESMNNYHRKELQDCNNTEIGVDFHYIRTVSAVLRSSQSRLGNSSLLRRGYNSSFLSWKEEETAKGPRIQECQRILKKILFYVPSMYSMSWHRNSREDFLVEPESCQITEQRAALQDKMMENDKFLVLKSMVPSISMTDEASVLGNTIRHLIELEARVDELESCIDLPELEAYTKYPYFVDQTSQKSEDPTSFFSKKTLASKRKARGNDKTEDETPLSLEVKVKEQEVLIEMRCRWRDYLLHDIMDAMNNLNLDAHTVQSSTDGGVLSLSVHSKLRGAALASPRMVKQVLSAVVGLC